MTGTCVLDGKSAINVGNSVSADGAPLELCQECYGKPLSVILLQLANLNRRAANMPPPIPRQ